VVAAKYPNYMNNMDNFEKNIKKTVFFGNLNNSFGDNSYLKYF